MGTRLTAAAVVLTLANFLLTRTKFRTVTGIVPVSLRVTLLRMRVSRCVLLTIVDAVMMTRLLSWLSVVVARSVSRMNT